MLEEQTPADPLRRLAGQGDACHRNHDCFGILHCCPKIGPKGTGLCYPKCTGVKGGYCNSDIMCGAYLKCCHNSCVTGTDATETCLTPQEQLAVLRNQLKSQAEIEMRKQAMLRQELAKSHGMQDHALISQVKSDLVMIEQEKIRMQQEAMRLQYLEQLRMEQSKLDYESMQLQDQQHVVDKLQYQLQSGYGHMDRRYEDTFYRKIQSLNVEEPSVETSESSKPPIAAIIGGSVGAVILLVIVALFMRYQYIKRKGKTARKESMQMQAMQTNETPQREPVTPTIQTSKTGRDQTSTHSIFMQDGYQTTQHLDNTTDQEYHSTPDILDYHEKQTSAYGKAQRNTRVRGQQPQEIFYHPGGPQ